MRVFITGANGFVGKGLVDGFSSAEGLSVIAGCRDSAVSFPESADHLCTGDLSLAPDLSEDLHGVDVVVHAAARVHVLRETSLNPLSDFRRENVEATLSLARCAANAGVRRFIFLSTVKAGVHKREGYLYADDTSSPDGDFAVSKLEAEQGLRELEKKTPMEVVIIRLPLVYGVGVKGNFQLISKAVSKGFPLPLLLVKNSRPYIGLSNLVDFVYLCLTHPKAPGEIFLVSDDNDVSTVELVRRLAASCGKKRYFLIPFPVVILRSLAGLVGKADAFRALCGTLRLDTHKSRKILGWMPRHSIEQELKKMAAQDVSI